MIKKMSSEMMPVVSVIIATFERVELLKRAMKSVLSQSYIKLEVIVVDDASRSSDALTMVDDLNDGRIRLIKHDTNKGVSAARNTGIKNASGAYVAFLDDDDIWLVDKIEQQLKVIADSEAAAVLTAYFVVTDNRYFYIQKEKQAEIRTADLRRGNLYGCSGLLVRRTHAKRLLFDETIGHGEDWDFLIRLSRLTKIHYIDHPLFILNDGGHQRITNKVKQEITLTEINHRLKQLDKHSDFLGKYWRNYHEACLYLGFMRSQNRRYATLIQVAKRQGVAVVLHVLLRKVLKNINIKLKKSQIKPEHSRIFRLL